MVDELSPEQHREQGLVGDRGRDTEQEPLWGLNSEKKLNPSHISTHIFMKVGTAQGKPGSGVFTKEGSA